MTASEAQSTEKAPFVLYHNLYSICSLMVRYALALRGKPKNPGEDMTIEERVIDIFKGEQLAEKFLCEINPKGQVPALFHPKLLPAPISGTLDMTLFIAEFFPDLLPATHRDQILSLLRRLHDINYFSISNGSKPAVSHGMKSAIENLLLKTGLSERYQDALKYKLEVTQDEKVKAVEPHNVKEELEKAKVLLSDLEKLLNPSSGPWMFGLSSPTVLDANLVPLIARLRDVGKEEMIPEGITRYANAAMLKSEWQDLMQGRKTIFGV